MDATFEYLTAKADGTDKIMKQADVARYLRAVANSDPAACDVFTEIVTAKEDLGDFVVQLTEVAIAISTVAAGSGERSVDDILAELQNAYTRRDGELSGDNHLSNDRHA
jgi:G:T/U-mismatch repair DNA glycosylase